MNIYLKKKFLGVLQNMKNRIPRSENKVKKKLRKKDYYKYQSSTFLKLKNFSNSTN